MLKDVKRAAFEIDRFDLQLLAIAPMFVTEASDVRDRALDSVLVNWIWPNATQNVAENSSNRLWNDAEFE
jgi:hypothetical protein